MRTGKFKIDLNGPTGNAFVILGVAKMISEMMGLDDETIDELIKDMESSNYDHLLDVFKRHFGDFVEISE